MNTKHQRSKIYETHINKTESRYRHSLAILVEVFNILLSVMDKELQKFHKETRTSTKLYID